MDLGWLRRHQKRVLIPLVAVIIVTFVFFWGGGGRPRDGRPEPGWVKIGDERISGLQLEQYRKALLVIARASRGMGFDDLAHIRYLRRAKLAERAGVSVSTEQLRETIRRIMSSPAILGTEEFTNADYRETLTRYNVSVPAFEYFVRQILVAEMLQGAVVSSAYVTGNELRVAFRRENDRVKLRLRDFAVAEFEKDVAPPTDEEIAKYYDEHKDLPPDADVALATEPEVSVEYAFVEKLGAARLAKTLRRADTGLRVEGLLGGAASDLAGRIAAAALDADQEARLRDSYERDKRFFYRLPAEKPKEKPEQKPEQKPDEKPKEKPEATPEEKPEEPPAATEEKKEGAVGSAGAGIASMIALPALGATAPEEPKPEKPKPEEPKPEEPKPEEPKPPAPGGGAVAEEAAGGGEPGAGAAAEEPPAEPEPPEERFRAFEEVRARVERRVERSTQYDAARQSATRVLEVAAECERLRPVGADALFEGLCLGPVPALVGSSRLAGRFDVLHACEEAGAVHGVTPLAKTGALKRVPRLGDTRGIPERAVSQAGYGRGDAWNYPQQVGAGSAAWRVADYVPPRVLTLEEARETIRKRIVHERAAELARKAAEDFRKDLQGGKVDASKMALTPALSVGDAKAGPFAGLGLREVGNEPVAIEEKGDSEVWVDVNELARDLAGELEKARPGAELGDLPERLAKEARAQKTARYRVAVVVERTDPGHSAFVGWLKGRAPDEVRQNREAFMREVWGDVVAEEVEFRPSTEFTEELEARRKREEARRQR